MDFSQLIHKKKRRWQCAYITFSVMLLLSTIAYLSLGETTINIFNLTTDFDSQLIYQLRLPRLFAAAIIGASLAISGSVLQVLLGNVLAEPGIIGVSGGASVAMVLILFFFPYLASPAAFMLSAIVGSLVFTFLLVSIAQSMHLTTTRLLLVGVAFGILSGSIVTWAFYFSNDLSLRQLMYWLMGSVGGVTWDQHLLSIVVFPVIIWLISQGTTLDRLMLGELHARQLGVNVELMRMKLIVAVSILVGASVAIGGIVGFVGLVVPHLLRMAFGSENRYLLPLSALVGALLLVCADLVARTALDSAELPLGVVTTTVGAPIFIWMLLKNHDSYQ
jgi:vitamin B12 transport system permease protein